MASRVGVFLCECGPNIKDALNLDALAQQAREMPGVAHVEIARLYCSEEERERMANDIRTYRLDRVVFAGCSPREHELTFRRVLERAGLNPYCLQIANIREQCAWVVADLDRATQHAYEIIRAAVKRVVLQQPLAAKPIPMCPDVLVIGAGVAGLSAALTLGRSSRKVYLVEKTPAIGGRMMRFGKLGPGLECSSCMLEPHLDEVLHHDRIVVLTCAEVEEVVGYFGNFTVRVRQKARGVVEQSCIGCSACIDPCPVRVPNEYNAKLDRRAAVFNPYRGALPNVPLIDWQTCLRTTENTDCDICKQACPFGAIDYAREDRLHTLCVGAIVVATGSELRDPGPSEQWGYGRLPNVVTHMELELQLNSSGPTEGKVKLHDGSVPQRIAVLHCVGSWTAPGKTRCSRTCCVESLKLVHQLREQLPQASIAEVYSDFCLPDKRSAELRAQVEKQDQVQFVRVPHIHRVRVVEDANKLSLLGTPAALTELDLVVLATGQVGGGDHQRLAVLLGLGYDQTGFFEELHPKLDPAATAVAGVLVAGSCEWPKPVEGAVLQAQAAAGHILVRLVPGEMLDLDPCVAVVAPEICSGCKGCVALCPYHAMSWDGDTQRAQVSDVLCHGCGTCAASCPSLAITQQHFTHAQILAEVCYRASVANAGRSG